MAKRKGTPSIVGRDDYIVTIAKHTYKNNKCKICGHKKRK